MIMEEINAVNEETSEVSETEDLLFSDTEDVSSLDEGVVLKIDYNARIVTQEAKCENDGDDYDMHFVEKHNLLGHRGSESGLHTSTEDLNISEDEEKLDKIVSLKSVNLDGLESTSEKNDTDSLSTLNYSHTAFKKDYGTDAEYISDEELSNNIEENSINKNKHKSLSPGLTVAGHSSKVKMVSPAILPTQKALATLNVKHIFSNSLLLDEDVLDFKDEQESPPMTCLEFLKSELSDGNNTDAEDISVGSLDDIEEVSREDRNLSEIECNAFDNPVCVDSRRSSTAGFHTEDEIFSMENFPDHSQRVKKRNFRIEKNEASGDSGTDEEIL